MRRLHFIGAIENRFIAKLYVFDQKEDEDSIESFIALLKKNFRSLFFSVVFAPQIISLFFYGINLFLYLVNDVLLIIKHIKYFSPIFISRYSFYIFELFVNFDVAIESNIIDN